MEDKIYYAALSSNEAIGPKRFDTIKSNFKNIKDFFTLNADEMMDLLGLKNINIKHKFYNMLEKGEKILKLCNYKNIQIIIRDDPLYHPRLKDIPYPPYLYYQKGRMDYDIKFAGIIGTRDISAEAASINEYFTKELINYNIGIVSGMARGHDLIAHKTALNESGFTAAILGCGIDFVYPPEHKVIYDKICSKGVIISEYPPGSAPLKAHFPLRNRIISGLSEAILLVQAPENSGALITAKYAQAQGRNLYVIPGNPIEDKNKGSNALILKGAKIALDPMNIITDILGSGAKKKLIKQSRVFSGGTEDYSRILENLNEGASFDDLKKLTGFEMSRLNHMLTIMEMEGLVTQYPGRIYKKKKMK